MSCWNFVKISSNNLNPVLDLKQIKQFHYRSTSCYVFSTFFKKNSLIGSTSFYVFYTKSTKISKSYDTNNLEPHYYFTTWQQRDSQQISTLNIYTQCISTVTTRQYKYQANAIQHQNYELYLDLTRKQSENLDHKWITHIYPNYYYDYVFNFY